MNPAGWIGRPLVLFLQHAGGVSALTWKGLYFAFVAPFQGRTRLRDQVFSILHDVGLRSFPIVCLISLMIGAIMVLQTGDVLQRYGQIREVPGLVALSVTRELGPLMTAIVLIARVGSSFTAVVASMRTQDEITALETMAIHPVGYLVAPRLIAMLVMAPCLTMFSFLVGMCGGALVASGVYGIGTALFVERAEFYLDSLDVLSGLAKGSIFGVATCMIACYFGMIAEGGSTGVGKAIMVAVVTSLVAVLVADVALTALFVNHLFPLRS